MIAIITIILAWFVMLVLTFAFFRGAVGGESDEEVPPCEQPVEAAFQHPRFPSGWCVICGAAPEAGCSYRGESDEG
jgi:hypothetical protein